MTLLHWTGFCRMHSSNNQLNGNKCHHNSWMQLSHHLCMAPMSFPAWEILRNHRWCLPCVAKGELFLILILLDLMLFAGDVTSESNEKFPVLYNYIMYSIQFYSNSILLSVFPQFQENISKWSPATDVNKNWNYLN